MKKLPESRLGKWAVGMTLCYVILILVFFLFMVVGMVDFNTGHWWDVTVGGTVPIALTAFVLSILAVRRERTVLIRCAVVLGIAVILFLLTHSLYIHD
jgi:cytochrome bd-type quinol oxidase subunit 2